MPQIMPLNWIMLIFYFYMIFYWINSIIFFTYFKSMNNMSPKNFKMKSTSWMW